MSSIKAAFKFLAFALLCLAIVPLQSLVLFFTKGEKAYFLPKVFHKITCWIFGIKIKKTGQVSQAPQTLFISNHISYLDIPALGSLIPGTSFVAKRDVEKWPVFGFLSKLQQTAFISRSRSDAAKETRNIAAALKNNKNLILFPEGTSTDGQEVRPFKSSLFALALENDSKELQLQPITISVLSANGQKPQTQEQRDIYAWHINMDTPLAPHLWDFAKGNGAIIQITFHPPLQSTLYNDRKTLAKECHDTVSKGLAKAA
ncbi:MAG: 1-acyl-sn-glycerol-3-phosphate acyltransferase [Alphaproteobacteria bacterium]|nr:1-acyl-sn-glycerol-3-phosphate acyltransferase [Alphaproteobacteria bacterium]